MDIPIPEDFSKSLGITDERNAELKWIADQAYMSLRQLAPDMVAPQAMKRAQPTTEEAFMLGLYTALCLSAARKK
jgi:hypothetical protein